MHVLNARMFVCDVFWCAYALLYLRVIHVAHACIYACNAYNLCVRCVHARAHLPMCVMHACVHVCMCLCMRVWLYVCNGCVS